MKKSSSVRVALVGIIMMLAAAVLLRYIDRHRSLEHPGLVMVRGDVLDDKGHVIATNTVALPERVLNYTSVVARVTSPELSILPNDTVFARRIYQEQRTNGFALQTSVVMMGTDRSSIHKPQFCLTGQGWTILTQSEDHIEIGGSRPIQLPVWKMIAEQPQTLPDGSIRIVKAIYVYWFVADGYITARHSQRMWWMARKLLTKGSLQRWAYVSEFGICLPGQEAAAYEKIKEFIAASVPKYHRLNASTVISGQG